MTDYLLDLDRLITVLFQQLTTMLDHWDGCSSHQWFSNNWGFGYRYKYLWHAISQSLSFIFQCCTLVFAQKCEKHIVKKGISHNNIYYIYVLVTNSANSFIMPMGLYTEVWLFHALWDIIYLLTDVVCNSPLI